MTNNNSTYKRLGDYIREVDVRNTDLKINKLVGLTIAKAFIPSVANTIGTDLSKYKIIKENQFACSLMQVSRDGKMPVAVFKGEDAIMSPAYPIFEICNEDLLPDYLQMWFSRSEFDREAVFYAVGGVRGSLDWNDFMDMKIPVPPLEEQRSIVSRYKAIETRIANNKQTIAKLEEAAQALYRKMFVDDVDVENLPDGWRMGCLGEVITSNEGHKVSSEIIRYYDTSSVTENEFSEPIILNKNIDEIPSRAQRPVKNGDILYSTVRPNLHHYGIIQDDNCENIVVSSGFAVIRSSNININNELLYLMLTDEKVTTKLTELADMSKATYPSIVVDDIKAIRVALPQEWNDEMQKTQEDIKAMYNHIAIILREQKVLTELLSLVMV